MKTFSMWFAPIVAAMLVVSPRAAVAQKALVYCPVSDGATCATLVSTLAGTGAYPGGVDRAYDGTNGTVDLRTADLFAYTVFVVPSLADGAAGTPYALLRDATVVAKLRAALIGRRAFWSGTPDLGATNRDKKNALIANLVTWAGANFATVRGPGIMALQDNSENASQQYDWVAGLTGVVVTSDYAPKTYASVRTISAAGVAILTSAGSVLAYENMASYGFYFPNGAPGVSLDAVGQTGTPIGGEVVLVTAEGANTGGASIKTDKNDYAPGTTVVMTGAGFQAGESVRLTLHEDPELHADRTFSATADASGGFVFTGFAPEEHDLGVRFILTAVGQASGKRAQTTFTDANPNVLTVMAQAPANGSVLPGVSATYLVAVGLGGNTSMCTVTLNVAWTGTSPVGVTPSFSGGAAITTNSSFSKTLTLATTNTGPAAGQTAAGTYNFNVIGGRGANCQGNGDLIAAGTLTVLATTATTIITSSLNPAVFSASVAFTATLSPASATGTIQFKDGAADLGSPVSIAAGVATLSTSGLSVGTHSISAVYSPGGGFTAGAVTGVSQVVNKASQTITFAQPASPTYGAAPIVLSGTATSSLAVTFTASGSCALGTGPQANTLSFPSAGACLVTAIQPGDANYNAAPNVSYSLTVAPKSLSVGSVTVANKVYDGSASATITERTLAPGTVGGDVVTLTGGIALFVDKNVGNGKTVNATGLTLAGANAANYTLASTAASTTANITALSVTPAVTVSNKIYDATTNATISTRTFTGKIAGDVVDLVNGAAIFATKTVEAGKLVSITGLSLQGADALNYTLTSTSASANADITPRQVAVGAITVSDKPYDGNTSATITARTPAAGDVLGADDVALGGGTATFATKAAGANKPVNITGLSIGGVDAANYTLLSGNATSSATITPKSVTASIVASSKGYDGTAAAQATGSAPTIAGDAVTVTVTNAAFDNRNVGNAKPVMATVALDGADAGNYTLASLTAASTANITARVLTIASVTAADKEYDGSDVATITAAVLDAGVVSPDAVALTGGTAAFDDKKVGNGKTVTAMGYTLDGADAGNYSLPVGTKTTTANITAKAIVPVLTASSKVYDATTGATIATRSLTGFVPGDAVTLTGGTATFGDKNVGVGKSVTASSFTLTGSDAANYELVPASATTSADITRAALTATATAANKTYDGNTSATPIPGVLSGVLLSDVVTLNVGTATFDTKNAGTGKTVTIAVSITGADATNYTVTTPVTALADITPKTIAGNVTAADKVYDGNTTAIVTPVALTGVVPGDGVTLNATGATFDSKDVGDRTATANLTLTGADAGNYSINGSSTAPARITKREVTATADARSRVYGDADPGLTYQVTSGSLVAGEVFAGAITRAAGENVGLYVIGRGTLALSANYALTYVPANFTITARPITVAATSGQSKIQGGVDPVFAYSISSGSIAFSDMISGSLGRAPGEGVGTYAILRNSLTLGANYELTFVGTTFAITPNAKPVLGEILLQASGSTVMGPLPKGTTVTLTSSFTDASPADVSASQPYTITVNWDDGSPLQTIVMTAPGPISATHTYTSATVATVVVTVTDKINTVASGTMIGTATQFLVIYDADAGFVTGGGWIDSPVGACVLNTACTTLGGKANFGFVAKYKRGANTPDGNTEFQFQAGGINFKSTSYQWLVVAGTKAQFKGVGTINGSGSYAFLITAIDGDARTTGKGPDAFRIKISNANGVVVYDNKMSASEDSDDATVLGGGSIQIHDK